MKRLCYVLSTLLIFAPLSAVLAKAPETPKIVFTSNREGNSEIYSMNPDGSDQINLTQHRAKDSAPVWSPTGEQILFVSDRGGVSDLYLMDADGTNVRQVFRKSIGREFPTWSPDGKAFAYQRFNKLSIYIASIDGRDEEELTDGLFPAWSPNGSEIAFMGGKFAHIGGMPVVANPRIQIINLQTHVEEKLLPGKIEMFNPAWRPDSTQIAFSGTNPLADARPTIAIYVVNRDGIGLKEIAAGGVGRSLYTTWSPHGNELIYNKRVGGVRDLFKVTLDGGIPEQLTHRQGDNFNADWFDPAFALPVSPQSSLLTTIWGKLKTRD